MLQSKNHLFNLFYACIVVTPQCETTKKHVQIASNCKFASTRVGVPTLISVVSLMGAWGPFHANISFPMASLAQTLRQLSFVLNLNHLNTWTHLVWNHWEKKRQKKKLKITLKGRVCILKKPSARSALPPESQGPRPPVSHADPCSPYQAKFHRYPYDILWYMVLQVQVARWYQMNMQFSNCQHKS